MWLGIWSILLIRRNIVRDSTRPLINSEILKKYAHVQSIAKDTIVFLTNFIKEGVSAADIKDAAETFMKDKGASSFWYYDIGALVLVGEQTTISISGKEYHASNLKVKSEDLVTVDLSPEIDGIWGDLARSFVVQSGGVVEAKQSELPDIAHGVEMEIELHKRFMQVLRRNTTFDEAYAETNSQIEMLGFESLDFNKNLGHSIAKNMDERIYIEPGNKARFKDVELFTFEPHIKKKGGKYGFKHENIYFFDRGRLRVL
jgi:methionine aminopeptidase